MLELTCSQEAIEEPLIGTASRNAAHFVLAIPKTEWQPKVINMTGEAGALAQLIEPLEGQAKLSLRNCAPSERGQLWLFPHGYRFDGLSAEDYPDLVTQVLNGTITFPYERVIEPGGHFVLVCTHGKRDNCCALHGTAMLRALRAAAPLEFTIWEVSHLGGHRFAATLVVQPAGQWYGRLRPTDAPALIDAIKNQQVLTEFYRGNASYPEPLQAAELWGLQQMGGRPGRVHLVNPSLNGRHAVVEVSLAVDGTSQTTRLTLEAQPYTFRGSCGNPKTEDRLVWNVIQVEPYPYG